MFQPYTQQPGLGINPDTKHLCRHHPGKIVQWEMDGEMMPGLQWSCCNNFVFDAEKLPQGEGQYSLLLPRRYDEATLRKEALRIKGCTSIPHVERDDEAYALPCTARSKLKPSKTIG